MLDIERLGIQFGGLRALHGLDLRVGEREIVGLIGPNGAGKTTVFNCVTGIYPPTSGDIRLGGRRLVGLPPHAVTRAGIARTFQNIRLFRNLSVLENVLVAFHPHVSYGLASAVLRRRAFRDGERDMLVRSTELLEILGLAGRAAVQARHLPYGEQRRLEIARALAAEPRVLLLDEPAAGMNEMEGRRLMDTIRFIRERFGVAVLLIEHDMRVVMGICERVLVLDHGVPIAEGKPEEIQRNEAVIEAYLGRRDAKEGAN